MIKFKNVWGAQGSRTDQARADLFAIDMQFPAALNAGNGQAAGANLFEQEVAFAIESFPFPERSREVIAVKYLNQTNYQIGADTASGSIDIPVRYAFNRRTAELLERWHWLTSNPVTGGVANTSEVKTSGTFYWLVPNMPQQVNVEDTASSNVMLKGPAYFLEGIILKGLKPSNADMTSTGLVTLTFTLQIDRYYPKTIDKIGASTLGRLFG